MTLISFFLIYFVVWWTVIFAILPIGVKSVHEEPDDEPKGVEGGAPTKPLLLKKLIATSLISLVLTVIIDYSWPSIDSWLSKAAGVDAPSDQAPPQ